MGLDVIVKCSPPDWRSVASRLPFTVTLRMIDGLPAFPDEEPPADWHELRVSLPSGMVTLRRVEGGVQLVTWENASQELLEQRDQLAMCLNDPHTK